MRNIIGEILSNWSVSQPKKEALVADYCKATGYPEMIYDENGDEIPNPMPKSEWVDRQIVRHVKLMVHKERRRAVVRDNKIEELELE